jgi:hypothetical protein
MSLIPASLTASAGGPCRRKSPRTPHPMLDSSTRLHLIQHCIEHCIQHRIASSLCPLPVARPSCSTCAAATDPSRIPAKKATRRALVRRLSRPSSALPTNAEMILSKLLGKSSRKPKATSNDAAPDDAAPAASAPSSPGSRSLQSPPSSPDKRLPKRATVNHQDRRHSTADIPSATLSPSSPSSPSSQHSRASRTHADSPKRSSPLEAALPTRSSRSSSDRPRNSDSHSRSPTKHQPPSRPSALRNPLSFPADSSSAKESEPRRKLSDYHRLSAVNSMSSNNASNGDQDAGGDPMDISTPGAYPEQMNTGSAAEERPPAPPLHRVPTGPPAPTPADAEAFKAAGNKFFKNGQFDQAVEQYSKGL